jgi:hypothetical protein
VTEDIRESALLLMVTILVKSPSNFYKQNIDQFINLDLKGSSANAAASQLIQGPHFASIFDDYTTSVGIQYSHVSNDPDIQNLVIHLSKILFFGQSLVNESFENVEWLTRIAVQIASINIQTGKKLIHDLLGHHTNDPKYLVYRSIAIKAAIIIFDSSSGFQKYAKSNEQDDFSKVINELPNEFEKYLESVYTIIDSLVGVNHFGSNGSIAENIIHKEIDSTDAYNQQRNIAEALLVPRNTVIKQDKINSFVDLEKIASMQTIQIQPTFESLKLSSSNGSIADLEFNRPIFSFDDANTIVSNTLTRCFSFLSEQQKNVSRYVFDNTLSDIVKPREKEVMNTTREQKVVIALLIDVFKLLQYVPCIFLNYL